ncbi:MAG: hypothetical protein AAFQ82_04695, partial [Myxococcota bacterium]
MPRDMLWRREPAPAPRRRYKIAPAAFVVVLVAVNVAVVLYHGDPRERVKEVSAPQEVASLLPEKDLNEHVESPVDVTAGLRSPLPVQRVAAATLSSGQLPAHALRALGIDDDTISRAFSSLKGLVDFRRMRPGHRFEARFDDTDRVLSLTLSLGVMEEFVAEAVAGGFEARQVEKTVETVVDHVVPKGRVDVCSDVI